MMQNLFYPKYVQRCYVFDHTSMSINLQLIYNIIAIQHSLKMSAVCVHARLCESCQRTLYAAPFIVLT